MIGRKKDLLRKVVYAIVFLVMLVSFIYLGNKYAGNSDVKEPTIVDFYNNVNKEKFEVISGSNFINKLKKGNHVIFIGSSKSEFSQKYIKELEIILDETELDKVYYYDIINDKAQGNSNYYTIVKLLDGYLTTTDTSVNNLLSPSLYIVDNGKVKYYNIETCVMKNTDKVEDYWTLQKELEFKQEIISAINKYYLNK